MTLSEDLKSWEKRVASQELLPGLPAIARLDGKCFHAFTKDMQRPYDQEFINWMVAITHHLAEEFNASFAYTESDEISLLWLPPTEESQLPFNGRTFKLNSILAADASTWGCLALERHLGLSIDTHRPLFDCRSFSLPNPEKAVKYLIWRQLDALNNALLMGAQAHYSQNKLHGKGEAELNELLFQAGVNFNDYPACFKRGTSIQRTRISRPFTTEEIEKLPPKHEARCNPDLTVERWYFRSLDVNGFGRLTNPVPVIFHGADPTY